MSRSRAILIAGPTASGKSSLALDFARAHDGVVINADSMQVYEDLQLITARPDAAEMGGVPHRLYGHVSGAEPYSVAQWGADVAQVLCELETEQRLPIIVGGTGLYFNALTQGLSPVPPIPDDVRQKWRAAQATRSASELHAELLERDPLTAERLRPSDPQRIVRALEVVDATGTPLAEWQKMPGKPIVALGDTKAFVICPETEALYAKCDARFDWMMDNGALDEVQALNTKGFAPELPVMRALGVPQLIAVLEGRVMLEEAVEDAKRETRRYAKRQKTWLRGNMMSWNWLSAQDIERYASNNFSFNVL